MLINDTEANARLNSPMNLINKLKSINNSKSSAMGLFGIHSRSASETKETKTFHNPFINKDDKTEDNKTEDVKIIETQSLVIMPHEQETNLDSILLNGDSQIKLAHAHDNALDLLNRAVESLSMKLDDVKADRLPSVISAASKTVESIRRERNEANKNTHGKDIHYHFYTPVQKKVSDYEVVEVA